MKVLLTTHEDLSEAKMSVKFLIGLYATFESRILVPCLILTSTLAEGLHRSSINEDTCEQMCYRI